MKLVIFGLTVSSSWGNGHATLWRGICSALARRGHRVIFFERDVPYYSANRDLTELPGGDLILYSGWDRALALARHHLADADAAMVTSFCPDGTAAADLVLGSAVPLRVFYDLDTPVTLSRLAAGQPVDYIGPRGLRDFDLVLSYTGGRALDELKRVLGARRVAPLYGSVEPEAHKPVAPDLRYLALLGHLGTYAADRETPLRALFAEPARRLPREKFMLAGSMYGGSFPWQPNIFLIAHLVPAEHPAFYCSTKLTLNVTRGAMARMGYCPSGRLFEAAACGAPVLSDYWEGLEQFFEPGSEILLARDTEEALDALTGTRRTWRGSRARLANARSHNTAPRFALENSKICWTPRAALLFNPPQRRRPDMWGIIPAAGRGSRIQPLAFSKELLPVGARAGESGRRPRAVSDYLVERLVIGGATRICFVISPAKKSDILEYYGGSAYSSPICYCVQPQPLGLCDSIFRALPVIDPGCAGADRASRHRSGFRKMRCARFPTTGSRFCSFPVDRPQLFDAVVSDEKGRVMEIQVKQPAPRSNWVWGAFKMPGKTLYALHDLWLRRGDEFIGTLVNAWLEEGGRAWAVRAGESYIDVGATDGYFEAIRLLGGPPQAAPSDAKISGNGL